MLGNTTEILFDKFEILEVLKKDEHAAVFLANHIYLSKKIILKVLDTQKISDHALVERFKREAKLLAQLDHPNIIKVLDFGTSKDYFYISFEYIEGDSLRNILKNRKITFDEKKHLSIQLLKSLHFAHSNKIIHRDIKPENIFIDRNLNLKLGDFGLALSSEDSFVTNPYSIVGTPSYMSPEQVRGAKLTVQSDLFSAGVVICEIFSGKNPFLKENVSLTLNEIMSYDENSIKDSIETLEPDIKNILVNLLRRKPENRYNSAFEVLAAFGIGEDQAAVFVKTDKRSKSKLAAISIYSLVLIVIMLIIYQIVDNPKEDNSVTKDGNGIVDEKPDNIQKPVTSIAATDTSSETTGNLIDTPQTEDNNEKVVDADISRNVRYGGLFVECSPWAEVFVDGERIETTPMGKPLTLTEGDHMVKLVHPDFPPYSSVVRIDHGKVTNVRVSLESLMGYIRCLVFPWGNVYINGDFKGQTPIRELVRVVPGFVRMTIKNPNYRDIDTTFNIQKGDTLQFRFTFKNN